MISKPHTMHPMLVCIARPYTCQLLIDFSIISASCNMVC